jgi:hypothetical protein
MPPPIVGLGTPGGVITALKSQFLSCAFIGIRVPSSARAVVTAKVIAEEVNNVIAAAAVPQCLSARISPPSITFDFNTDISFSPGAGIDGIHGTETS